MYAENLFSNNLVETVIPNRNKKKYLSKMHYIYLSSQSVRLAATISLISVIGSFNFFERAFRIRNVLPDILFRYD